MKMQHLWFNNCNTCNTSATCNRYLTTWVTCNIQHDSSQYLKHLQHLCNSATRCNTQHDSLQHLQDFCNICNTTTCNTATFATQHTTLATQHATQHAITVRHLQHNRQHCNTGTFISLETLHCNTCNTSATWFVASWKCNIYDSFTYSLLPEKATWFIATRGYNIHYAHIIGCNKMQHDDTTCTCAWCNMQHETTCSLMMPLATWWCYCNRMQHIHG
jgi:hypothetical protein